MNPTTADTLLEVFRAAERTPTTTWDEIMSYFVLSLRMEREGLFEIGRAILQRAQKDASSAITYAQTVVDLPNRLGATVGVNPEDLTALSQQVRRLASPQAPTVTSAIRAKIEKYAGSFSNRSVRPQEDVDEALAAAQKLLDAWGDLETTYTGAQGMLAGASGIPQLDAAFLANKNARWLNDAAWQADTGKFRDVFDSLMSSVVFTRLVERGVVPPDIVFSGTKVPFATPVVPAKLTATNSGPYRIVAGDTLIYTTNPNMNPQSIPIPSPPARPELSFRLAQSDVMGRYVLPITAGQYVLQCTANTLSATYAINLNFVTGQFGEVYISAQALALAINNANIPGVTAQPVPAPPPQTAMSVLVSCVSPASGPGAWLRFDPGIEPLLMTLGFPSYIAPNHLVASTELVTALNPLLSTAVLSSRQKGILSGNYAMVSAQVPSRVFITKGSSVCAYQNGHYEPSAQGYLNRLAVGDEVWLIDQNQIAHGPGSITAIDATGFSSDLDVSNVANCTVNPLLAGYEAGTGLSLQMGGRAYQFSDTKWFLDTQKKRYVDLGGARGHHTIGAGQSFSIVQDIIEMATRSDQLGSYLELPTCPFQTETGMSTQGRYGTSRGMVDVAITAVDGFTSRVKVGDIVEFPQMNAVDEVAAIEDGKITLLAGRATQNASANIRIRNGTYQKWQTTMATPLPSFDSERFQQLLQKVKDSRNPQAAAELSVMANALEKDLAAFSSILLTFTSLSFSGKSTSSMISAMRAQKTSYFIDRLTKGDLSVFTIPARKSSIEGETADSTGTVARDLSPQLTFVERAALSLGDRR